ncbi:MAG: hypothetical protein ACXV7I_02235 [Ilumatobacteraceae bacterium]
MQKARTARWKVEAIAAALFAIAAAVTAVFPQWMEALGFDPYHGSGAAEWAIVGLFGVAFLMCGTASSVHLRKQRALAVVGASSR